MVGDALRLAFGTLTAVRVRPPGSLAPPVPGRAMAFAPLAGLVPGLAAALVVWMCFHAQLPSSVSSVGAVGMFALTTRALHLDGLADTADGLASSYDRESALAVMRRGDIGPTGVAAVVLVLLLQVTLAQHVLAQSADRLADEHEPAGWLRAAGILVAVAVAARVAVPVACRRGVPAARSEGLGATVAGSVSPGWLVAAPAVSAAACSFLTWFGGLPWWAGAGAVLAAGGASALLTRRAVGRLGGITGDVLGAGVEIGAAAALLTMAVSL
jgi:adenosylcobinamide-GDP ribazoletransferase